MNFKIIPLSIKISKTQYGLFLFGYHWMDRECGFGFSLSKERLRDSHVWYLYLSAWLFSKRLNVYTKWDKYKLVCNECNGSVWKRSLYCSNCACELDYNEDITYIPINNKGHPVL